MLKQPIYYEFNLDARTSPSKLIAISHVDDKYSEVLEVAVKQNDRFVYMGGATVVARMVLHRDKDYLLSDDVTCTVNANGNILIPFDNAVVKTSQGVVKIEVNITRDTDELTLQFPLWVSVTGSILDNAEVTPDSKGTIPDLLKDAADALDDAKEALEASGDYDNLDNKPQINGVTLSGNKTAADLGVAGWEIAAIDNCIEDGVLYSTSINNQAAYVLARNITTNITQYAFSRDGRVMWRTRQAETPWQPAGEWSAWEEIGGADDYNDLLNKPQIQANGQTSPLSGTLAFSSYEFFANVVGTITNIQLKNNVFESYLSPANDILYNFNLLGEQVQHSGVFKIRKVDVTNLPQEFSNAGQTLYVYHFLTNTTYSDLVRMVTYDTADGVKMWIQLVTLGGMDASDNVQVTAQTDWVDITGSSSRGIVSAEINSDGHLIIYLDDDTEIDAGSVMVPKTDIANAVVTLSTSEFIYDGNQKLPTIRSVMLHGTALIKNQDYVIVSQPETAIGDYLLIIQGIGDYVGTSSASWSIEAQERYIFGVMWDYSLSSPQLTRLTPQNDPLAIVTNTPSQEPTACVGNDGSGQSDFDNYMPWKGMRRYNYIDGQIVDFIDYSSGETFVYIPEFWSRIVNDYQNSKMYFYISSAEMGTFVKHPGSGRYMSRYECNDNFLSVSDFMPKVSTSLTDFRTGITAIDNKHFQNDFSTYNAIELLYVVEFAHLNSQAKIGAGISSGSVPQTTGQTDILTYHTGRVLGTDNLSAIQYRWVENLWGNVWKWVDGILIQEGLVYICEDPSKFSSAITNDYKNTGLTTLFQGWLKTESDYANSYLIPLSNGGSDSIYTCDSCYYASGLNGLRVSGSYSNGSAAGLFCWSNSNNPDYVNANISGRSILILGGDS